MKLQDLVHEKTILPDLQAGDRNTAIIELLDAFVSSGQLDTVVRDTCFDLIRKREQRGSTAFGHGVAVPHAKHSSIDTRLAAIGISHTGVEFNALNKEPVFIIFLLLSPEDRPEEHLDAMEAIFGQLSQQTFRSFLRQATSVEDVVTLLKESDTQTPAS